MELTSNIKIPHLEGKKHYKAVPVIRGGELLGHISIGPRDREGAVFTPCMADSTLPLTLFDLMVIVEHIEWINRTWAN